MTQTNYATTLEQMNGLVVKAEHMRAEAVRDSFRAFVRLIGGGFRKLRDMVKVPKTDFS